MTFRVKCFWIEKLEPEVIDWNDGVGSPRWRRLDTGEVLAGASLPAGALYIVDPEHKYAYTRGPDGEAVACVLPDGSHWRVDSFASNCTKPGDKIHRCWVRHGSKPGVLHVDKKGLTCAAGAGSIQTKNFHGFLHNGELYSC
jgi:hypothetical protein